MIANLERVSEVISGLRRREPIDAHYRGPVPLAKYFAETNLDHVELPAVTIGAVADYLQQQGIPTESPGSVSTETPDTIRRTSMPRWTRPWNGVRRSRSASFIATRPRLSLDLQDPGLQYRPLVSQPLGLTMEQRAKLIAEFM
jgi:hypothetical protein